jgi:hypothetical protein
MKFTKAEQKKIAKVLTAQKEKFKAGISECGYNNDDGGCPNCGDIGGFYYLMYQLEQAFGFAQ